MCVQIFHYRGPPCTRSLSGGKHFTPSCGFGGPPSEPCLLALGSHSAKLPAPAACLLSPTLSHLHGCLQLVVLSLLLALSPHFQPASQHHPPPTPCAVSFRHCLHPGTQASLSCSPGGEASLLWVTFHQQGPAVRLREPSIPGPTAPAPKRTGPPACSKLDCRQTDNTQQADHTPPVPPRPSVYLPLVFVLSQSCLPCTPTPEDELFPQEC